MTDEKLKNMKLTETNWKRLKQVKGDFISRIKPRDFKIYFIPTMKIKTSLVWLMTINVFNSDFPSSI